MANMHVTEIGSSLPSQSPVPAGPEPIAEISATLLRAQAFTAAGGVALLVREGPALVCRASNGTGVLEFGAQVPLENGFFGLCAGSKKPQKCDDADTDPRIDSASYGRVKPRSVLAVPVRDAGGAVVAVLGVYSGAANAFTNTHIAILRTQADSLARAVQQLPKFPAGTRMPSAAAASPREAARAVVPVSGGSVTLLNLPAPAGDAPDPAIDPPQPPAPPAPVAMPEATPAPPAPVAGENQQLLTLADDLIPASRPPEPSVSLSAARAYTIPAPRTFTLPGPLPSRRRKVALLRVAAIAGLCLLGTLVTTGWLVGRKPAPPIVQPGSPAVPAVLQADAAAAEAAKTPATPAQPVPAEQAAAEPPVVPAVRGHETAPSQPAELRQRAPEKSVEAERAFAEPVKKPIPASLPDPAPPVIEVEAPPVAFTFAPTLPAKAAPVVHPPAPRRSEIEPARLLQRIAPQYPSAALHRKTGGQVELSAVIRKDGSVGDVRMVSGNPVFRDSAIAAVRQWRYSPAMLDGAPAETSARIVLTFNPPK